MRQTDLADETSILLCIYCSTTYYNRYDFSAWRRMETKFRCSSSRPLILHGKNLHRQKLDVDVSLDKEEDSNN